MILERLGYNVATLLNSDDAVAICELEGEKLKELILDVGERGWGLVVVETPRNEHFLVFAANPVHQGNLVGDVRRWSKERGCNFFVKSSKERIPTPHDDLFILPDGREIQIRAVYTRAGNFTHWGLSKQKVLPDGYLRL
jgi:hypothetical protein